MLLIAEIISALVAVSLAEIDEMNK